MYKAIKISILILMCTPLYANGLETGDSNISFFTILSMSFVGVIAFYFSKVAHVLHIFDFTYWWADNKLSFLWTLLGVAVVSTIQYYDPNLLNTALSYIGVAVNTTEPLGSFGFSLFYAGVVYELVKKVRGKGKVITDGQGNKVEDDSTQ